MTIEPMAPLATTMKIKFRTFAWLPLKCLGDMIKSKKQDEYIKSKWQQIAKLLPILNCITY